ncbi:MAG: YqeG family HAD IIIA-type phosphatase [Candidatus Margulisbacteria bacterium]|nr:YqeG family HAD IIIA-type phosphatase [Candidatus Margulisiibacteriota bacterium]
MNSWQEILKPNEIVKDIHEIDFAQLKSRGIKALILDIDDTLIPRQVNDISPAVFEWVTTRKEEGFKLCLASNSRHPIRVKYIGDTLEVPAMALGFKPLPFAFWRSLKALGVKPEEAAMIGDQLFMDILGANLVKIYTIYVKHLTPETFLPRIWMRQAEEWLLNRI